MLCDSICLCLSVCVCVCFVVVQRLSEGGNKITNENRVYIVRISTVKVKRVGDKYTLSIHFLLGV